jgi:hypothetical protein
MARQEVVMIKCDRCGREELQPASTQVEKLAPDFESQFKGNRICYQDVCKRCEDTISLALQRLKEWDRDLKSLMGPIVSPNEAPPVTPAPDYSPPKPHSAASMKR